MKGEWLSKAKNNYQSLFITKKQTATGLLNMGCHREIPKQRSIDLPKACSRLFFSADSGETSVTFKHKDL